MRIVKIYGSHGVLWVHARTGLIVAYDPDPSGGDSYSNIARFDPTDIERLGGGGDILGYGFWDHAGMYAEPMTTRAVSGCISLQPVGRFITRDWEFDEWVPLALLPPPN